MLPRASLALSAAALLLLVSPPAAGSGAGEEPGRALPAAHSRPYAVLKTQNLALMGSVFGVLLVAMILMAVCIYKPVRRR